MDLEKFEEQCWVLLEREGIKSLTIKRLSYILSIPELFLIERFPKNQDIFLFLWKDLENKIQIETIEGSPHEILFESCMAFFDEMAGKEKAIKNITLALCPNDIILLEKATRSWIQKVFLYTFKEKEPYPSFLKEKVFFTFFLQAMLTWASDDSLDKSETMRYIDSFLRKLKTYQDFFIENFNLTKFFNNIYQK